MMIEKICLSVSWLKKETS